MKKNQIAVRTEAKELITAKSLVDAGIVTKIDQNDLIDIITDEKIESLNQHLQIIKDVCTKRNEVYKELDELTKQEAINHAIKHKLLSPEEKKIILSKGKKEDKKYDVYHQCHNILQTNLSYCSSEFYLISNLSIIDDKNFGFQFDSSGTPQLPESIHYIIKIELSPEKEVHLKFKVNLHTEKILKKFEEYKKFNTSLNYADNINYIKTTFPFVSPGRYENQFTVKRDAIARLAKNELNKKILKAQAPDFINNLNATLGTTL